VKLQGTVGWRKAMLDGNPAAPAGNRAEASVMRAAVVAAALALLVGCAFPDAQVRKSAANDFRCPEDEIVVHELPGGYLARGCRKEAEYLVQDGRVTRRSEITRATVDERPELPIDRVPGTNSIGVE